MHRKFRAIAIDTLGVLCFVGVVIFGWLPGPGGLPLLLAGLGLLAVNHEWARRWLENIRDKGEQIGDILFPNQWVAKLVYDLVTACLVVAGFYILETYQNGFVRSWAILAFTAALAIFLFNRKRLKKIVAFFSSKNK